MSKEPSESERAKNSPSTAISIPQVDQRLDAVLAEVPEPQREAIREVIRDSFTAVIQGAPGPRIDAETAKILTESIDKDNDNKFRYLTQKQKDEAEEGKRRHDFDVMRHADRRRMIWPILVVALFLIVGCIVTGVYFCYVGKDVLGATLVTGALTGAFGFLAGAGTTNLLQR